MFTAKDLHDLAEICRQASEAEILPRFRSLDEGHIAEKSHQDDLVTIADQAAERFILSAIRPLYPEALLIGEESVYEDRTALDHFAEAELAFVLDPIDGTWHFANGSVAFGLILGVASKGKMIGGLIYEPITGDYLWAVKGQGAFERAKGQDRRLSAGHQRARPLTETMGSFSFGLSKGAEREKAIRAASQMGRVMDYRCAATEYRLLNTGATAFVIFQGVLNLWDHGAGLLITEEAGGVARMIDGREYAPQISGKLLVAESEARWNEVAALFTKP